MRVPKSVEFKNKSKILRIQFDDEIFELTYEFLRVFSPSAEVRGHGPGQSKLQVGKRDVTIVDVEPVGEYAIKLTFSDGHDTGLYTWDWLEDLCYERDELWTSYLEELKAAGASRDPNDPANKPFEDKPKSKCPNH